jgi:hypothetical protein
MSNGVVPEPACKLSNQGIESLRRVVFKAFKRRIYGNQVLGHIPQLCAKHLNQADAEMCTGMIFALLHQHSENGDLDIKELMGALFASDLDLDEAALAIVDGAVTSLTCPSQRPELSPAVLRTIENLEKVIDAEVHNRNHELRFLPRNGCFSETAAGSGHISVAEAQKEIATDWIAAYRK